MADADLLEGFTGLLALGFAHAFEPAELAIGAHDDDVERAHGKVPVDALALRNVGDEIALLFVRLAIDKDFAGGLRNKVEAGFEKSGLAGTVRSHDTCECPLRNIEFDVPKHGLAMVRHGKVVDRKGKLWWVFGTQLGWTI